MSLFEPNADATVVPITAASTGPRLGFQEAFEAAFDTQVRTMSVFGTEAALRELEDAQNKRIRAAGLRPPDALNGSESFTAGLNSRRYTEAVTWLSGRKFDGQQEGDDEFLTRGNAELDKLKTQRPDLGIKNYGELWDDVKTRARDAERRSTVMPTSTLGDIGEFLGGAVGGVDPRTDPFNALTLGVGGAGKSVLTRLATQVAGQGAIETINQFSGVQQNRADLGLEHGTTQALTQIGASMLGGAGIQIFGEGLAAGARKLTTGRWFADHPGPVAAPKPVQTGAPEVLPPAPPRIDFNAEMDRFMAEKLADTPLGPSRLAQTRTTQDIDAAMRQLERYDGPQPFELEAPRAGDTAIPTTPTTFRFDQPYQRAINNLDTLEDFARKVDPETFNQLDKLRAQQEEARNAWTLVQKGNQLAGKMFDAIPEQLAKIDAAMRDLAPLVNRAFEAVQGKWAKSGPSVDTLRWLQRLENRDFKFMDDAKIAEMAQGPHKFEAPPRMPTLEEKVPLTRGTGPTSAKLPAGADAADRIAATVADHFKAAEEGGVRMQGEAKRLSDPEAPRDPVVLDTQAVVDKHTTATGRDAAAAVAEIKDTVRQALGEGARVTITTEGKTVEIAAYDRAGAIDKAGAKVDVPFGSKIEITPNTYVNLPDGARLHLDAERLNVPTEDGGMKNMTVREFLREFELNDQALHSVMTCSRSPHS